MAHLTSVGIPLQFDIGFADAVLPTPLVLEYPTLLGMPAPRLRAFLLPLLQSAARGEPLSLAWRAPGPWMAQDLPG